MSDLSGSLRRWNTVDESDHIHRTPYETTDINTAIADVRAIGNGRVEVTLSTGAVLTCMDDGSFTDYIGGSDG